MDVKIEQNMKNYGEKIHFVLKSPTYITRKIYRMYSKRLLKARPRDRTVLANTIELFAC